MASRTNGVWAIDLGNNSLKALHLSAAGDVLEVIGFDNIQHNKILTSSDVEGGEKDELIALSLRQFANQNDWEGEDVIVSVPSQNSFSRFVNLPPVEKKKIPEIVSFEAAQQIPFDINSVQWDWQLMGETEKGENKVGIFAIKNKEVNSLLEYFDREEIQVSHVQMAPMALYNYVSYDYSALLEKSENNGVIVVDIGAENTDLVICTNSAAWQRSIPMGGNAFTQAIADAFKLTFAKAEKLKRTAPMSKYARQILQAMKPVFTDLASEVQRSLNFYSRSNAETKFCKVIAFGGGTKMRGLLKYLQQTLQIPVERPDAFKKLAMSPDISAAKFHESVSDFGVVYGLGLQVLGFGRIENNLLPRSISRSMAWANKSKYFTAAACLLLLVSALSFARTFFDRANYNSEAELRGQVETIIRNAGDAEAKLSQEQSKSSKSQAIIEKAQEPFQYRDVLARLNETILSALPDAESASDPKQKELYAAFKEGEVGKVLDVPRSERKQIFITSISVHFSDNISSAAFGSTSFQAGGSRDRKTSGGSEAKSQKARDTMQKVMQKMFGGSSDSSKFRLRAMQKKSGGDSQEGAEIKSGFVVTITGYSPYSDLLGLMDPTGVVDKPEKWGFITRLMHLDEISGGKSPFKLYQKSNKDQFELKIEKVDVTKQMPAGIGMEDQRDIKSRDGKEASELILIDPMTKEVISTVSVLDSDGREKLNRAGEVVYKENDSWFKIDMKFIWENAPEQLSPQSL